MGVESRSEAFRDQLGDHFVLRCSRAERACFEQTDPEETASEDVVPV